MSELPNFPMKNQRITTLTDGTLDPNHDDDCVPESLAAAAQYFLGGDVIGGNLKEKVYGRDYTGVQSADAYIDLMASMGLQLFSLTGSPDQLVSFAHAAIQNNCPAIFTEPDPYSVVPGMTHVCVWYKESPGQLTAMDPFIANSITNTDSGWVALLSGVAGNQLWIMKQRDTQVDISAVQQFFIQLSNGMWRSMHTGYMIGGAILTFYRSFGDSLHGLTYLGLPVSNELPVHGYPGCVDQHFSQVPTVRYDPGHICPGVPPGAGPVYIPLYEVPVSDLSTQLQQATAQVQAMTGKIQSIKQIVNS